MTEFPGRASVYAAGLTVAVGALAGTVARMTVFVPLDESVSMVEARIGATLVTLLAVLVAALLVGGFTVLPLYAVLSGRFRAADAAWFVVGALTVVGLLVGGFVGVQPFAGGFADATTEHWGGSGGPLAFFDGEEWTTDGGERVLVITHEGGHQVPADALWFRGDGFADADGADQAGPGPWKGATTGERPRRGGPAVAEGDAVAVGVTDDCEIRLVYERADRVRTTFYHECGSD